MKTRQEHRQWLPKHVPGWSDKMRTSCETRWRRVPLVKRADRYAASRCLITNHNQQSIIYGGKQTRFDQYWKTAGWSLSVWWSLRSKVIRTPPVANKRYATRIKVSGAARRLHSNTWLGTNLKFYKTKQEWNFFCRNVSLCPTVFLKSKTKQQNNCKLWGHSNKSGV